MDTSTCASESTPSDHLNDIITKNSQEIPSIFNSSVNYHYISLFSFDNKDVASRIDHLLLLHSPNLHTVSD